MASPVGVADLARIGFLLDHRTFGVSNGGRYMGGTATMIASRNPYSSAVKGSSAMPTWQVQLWPDGEWDGKPYQKVDAASAKAAAEQLHGGPLTEVGSMYKIRAQVRPLIASGKVVSPTVFYEP